MRQGSEFDDVTAQRNSDNVSRARLWLVSRRYNRAPAPGGLALVQDFLNTRANATYPADLLVDGRCAQAWADDAIWAWSRLRGEELRSPTLDDCDAGRLRRLRDIIDTSLERGGSIDFRTSPFNAPTDFVFRNGQVFWTPSGDGWRWMYAAIMGEVLVAQLTATWGRIKQCANQNCRATFFDRTWDRREMWHDALTRA
jgi:hypothetical protein